MSNREQTESVIGDLNFFKEILKKSGYRSIAFGIAEILDNSIDANANEILILLETDDSGKLTSIGFLDNGNGMSDEILHKCLKVGSHFGNTGKRRGKYGFGLPGSSFAFSDRVEIYSWTKNSSTGVKMVGLNLSDLNDGIQKPSQVELPLPYRNLLKEKALIKWGRNTIYGPVNFRDQGTLIIWKGCERVFPKNPKILIEKHLVMSLARLFRHFLTADTWSKEKFPLVNISIINNLRDGVEPTVIKLTPNDPLFIMKDHFLSEKFYFKEKEHATSKFSYKGSDILIRFSIAPTSVKDKFQGSNSTNVKYIGSNTGISIIREGREIDLDHFKYFKSTEERHRWWGCEILFSKEADDFFGVPANKQHVDQLKEYSEEEYGELVSEDTNPEDLPVWLAINHKFKLTNTLSGFLKAIRKSTEDESNQEEENDEETTGKGDIVDDPDGDDESESISDSGERDTNNPEMIENAKRVIKLLGLEPTQSLVERFILHKVVLIYAALTEDAGFVDINVDTGVCVVTINTSSYFYQNVISNLKDSEIVEADEIHRGIELMILSYARCLDLSAKNKDMFKTVLYKWKVKFEEYLRDHFKDSY